MVTPIALSVSAIFAVLSALHVYWAVGGGRGLNAAVPERADGRSFRPGPAGTLLVALLLAAAATLVLERAGIGPGIVSPFVSRWGSWGVAIVLTARAVGEFRYVGFFKRHRQTRFAWLDTRFFSPLALFLGLGAGIVACCGV